MIYLDYSATTPMTDIAVDSYAKAAQQFFANASSLHDTGYKAATALQEARQSLANITHVNYNELYFTGSGSEANILTLLALAEGAKHKGRHILTTELEHASVKQAMSALETKGFEITMIPINEEGLVTKEAVSGELRPDTILVSICHASADLGTIQPIESIGPLLKKKHILFHSDWVQTFGKIGLPIPKEIGLDAFTLSAHKVYGPKGIGLAYIQENVRWVPPLKGGTHESGFRPGTVNVPAALSFTAAAEEIVYLREQEASRLHHLRKKFMASITNDRLEWLGSSTMRLPHHSAFLIEGVEGQWVMLELNRHDISIGTGSACQTGVSSPPDAMKAIGCSAEKAHGLARLTMGRFTTEDEMEKVSQVLNRLTRAGQPNLF
ncbi:IscS subfamily cysteine desulfurase [Salsuginibacillus kocurii]|uniref:IscS subfamily cysteine desulfurase n=1 Tax=Salsuginibacillus kocurii TaxID=427078 RepID=UPI000374CF7A|nr:IscS subfamily cysteine desulfurase [Salsuginibacillus kocurii]